jgi:hypothetical protein
LQIKHADFRAGGRKAATDRRTDPLPTTGDDGHATIQPKK